MKLFQSRLVPWLWAFVFLLVAGARLNEVGISLDPAIFCAVARTLSRNHLWWSLSASPNLFPQFYEHPFLGIWMNALVFRVLGASDMTARLSGLFFGVGTIYFLYRLSETLLDRVYANAVMIVTLFSPYFVGRFATGYFEIPLTFFFFAGLFAFYRALHTQDLNQAAAAGLCLGAAFLTKGMAALPFAALLGALTLYKERLTAYRSDVGWVTLGIGVFVTAAWLFLQNHYGSYSFWHWYLYRRSTLTNSGWVTHHLIGAAFFMDFLKTHAPQIVLALASLFIFIRQPTFFRTSSDALFIGIVGTFLFLCANGVTGDRLLHYYYSIYPFTNLVAALTLYPFLKLPEEKD